MKMKKLLSKYLIFFVILIIDLITIGLFLLGYFSNFAVVFLVTYVGCIIGLADELYYKKEKTKFYKISSIVFLILALSGFISVLKHF